MSLLKRWLGLGPVERVDEPLVCPRCRGLDFVLLATLCRAFVGENPPTLYPRALKVVCDSCGAVLRLRREGVEMVKLERAGDPQPTGRKPPEEADSDLAVPAAERQWRKREPAMEDKVL